MPYHAYLVVKWNPANLENYDPYVLYWTGISVGIYYNLTSLSVLLLSLDRLLILRFYIYKKVEKWFLRLTVVFLLGCSIYSIADFLMVLPLERETLRYCQSVSCVTSSRTSFVPNLRLLTTIMNLLLSAYFLFTFRSVNKKEKLNIRVVKMIIALDIALNAFPSLAYLLLTKVFKVDVYSNAGPILTVLVTANIAFSAAYTWFILVRRSKEAVISVVPTSQINPQIMSKV